jgi:hypothetical protein
MRNHADFLDGTLHVYRADSLPDGILEPKAGTLRLSDWIALFCKNGEISHFAAAQITHSRKIMARCAQGKPLLEINTIE